MMMQLTVVAVSSVSGTEKELHGFTLPLLKWVTIKMGKVESNHHCSFQLWGVYAVVSAVDLLPKQGR